MTRSGGHPTIISRTTGTHDQAIFDALAVQLRGDTAPPDSLGVESTRTRPWGQFSSSSTPSGGAQVTRCAAISHPAAIADPVRSVGGVRT